MVPDTRMITMTNDVGNNFGMSQSYGAYQPVQKCQTVINVYVFAFLKGHLLNAIHIASKHCLVLCPVVIRATDIGGIDFGEFNSFRFFLIL